MTDLYSNHREAKLAVFRHFSGFSRVPFELLGHGKKEGTEPRRLTDSTGRLSQQTVESTSPLRDSCIDELLVSCYSPTHQQATK
jgi:hypothetical protein